MSAKGYSKPKERDPEWYRKVNGSKQSTFVRYSLSPDEKAAMKAWCVEHQGDCADVLEKLVDSGYAFSIKSDAKNGGVSVFLLPDAENKDNQGWILSSRASGVIGAVLAVAWRHYVLFDAVWPKHDPTTFELDDA